ncbi:MAG: DNA polymerase I [Chitinophagales bacterium]|nr:DNA polymerase I [Chitinophagales bacterium]MDW8427224.1 DNA polymerase I [Chitinophagales bacterium]
MSETNHRVFLLDAYALIYRAYFALSRQPLYNSKGMNTSAVYGFTNTLLDLLEQAQPTHMAVCFDTAAPTVRDELYEAYKAQREAMPEDIEAAIPYIKQIIYAFRIPCLELDGYEADDLIGTLARQAAQQGYEVFMVTPDKDYGQLVTERIRIYKPAYRGEGFELLGPEEIKARWEISEPKQVIDILALMGDASDNIPGVPGIGEKTAKKLIQQYGTVERVLEHAHELKGKLQENLVSYRDLAMLSKQLATINTEVPVVFDAKQLRRSEPDKALLTALFQELEFRTLGRRILGEGYSVVGAPRQSRLFEEQGEAIAQVSGGKNIYNTPHTYHIALTNDQRQQLVALLLHQQEFSLDTETTHLDANRAELVGLSFSFRKGEAWYVPIPADQGEARRIIEQFRPVLTDARVLKVGQNIKYDFLMLKWYGLELGGPLFDTMLAHFLLEPDGKHSMDYLAETYLRYQPVSIEELIGKRGPHQGNMREVPLERIAEYAAEDADITLQLKHVLAPKLVDQNLEKLFREVEMPLVPVLAEMEFQGVSIDIEFLEKYSEQLQREIQRTEQVIYELAGRRFNIASPKQLGEVLFDHLKIPFEGKKTKTGQYATDEETLRRLSGKHPIADHLLDYRELTKLKSTYVDALPRMVNPRTGRVHTSFNQAIAATGRLSSIEPNLQNIPIRTDRGREIRKAFVARGQNRLLLSCDYSQIELRIIAALSGDENMLEAFRQGLDIHAATAARIFGVSLQEVTPEMRRRAKAVNFGIAYGQTAYGLAQTLGISRKEAQQIIDTYQQQFPGVTRLMNEHIAFGRQHGFVQTILGRRRWLRDINSANQTVRAQAERLAINSPIQGSAADLIKVAMIQIHEQLKHHFRNSYMILQVHDELVFDVTEAELMEVRRMAESRMKHALPLAVPIEVSSGVGKNWLDAH